MRNRLLKSMKWQKKPWKPVPFYMERPVKKTAGCMAAVSPILTAIAGMSFIWIWKKCQNSRFMKQKTTTVTLWLFIANLQFTIYKTKFFALSKASLIPATFFPPAVAKKGCPPPPPWIYFPNSRTTCPAFRFFSATNSFET